MNTTIRRLLIAAMSVLMAVCILPFVTTQAYAGTAGAKTGDEYPYYGEDPTAYTPETITLDNTNPTEWSKILYPGDKLKFTKDEEGSSPRFMGFSSTAELSENYGFTDGTTYITGEVNATGETLYIYDSIVLSSDADYALYIYGNSRGVAGLKDNPDTADVNEGNYGAYGISMIEKIPLYIYPWYQNCGGRLPNDSTPNPEKILNPKRPTLLKLNTAPVKEGEKFDYWSGAADHVSASAELPAGAVVIWPVYPINSSEQYFFSDYRYSDNYQTPVQFGLTANYKPITYTIELGNITDYVTAHGDKSFLQWYWTPSTYTKDYLKSQVSKASSWLVVGQDTKSNLDINGTVTSVEGTADYHYYGLRAQAPTENYILSGWSITDSAGNELNDTYKLRMTETYAEKVNGIWNYLLCISTNGNYFDANLADGETFIVTPIFVERAQTADINKINITMDLQDYEGGDAYTEDEGRATIIDADAGKYTIEQELTTIDSDSTHGSSDYVVEPGDTLYYSSKFKANKAGGYAFDTSVDLYINDEFVATATSDGETVWFQDVVEQTATGGVTGVTFNTKIAGENTWSASVDFFGISQSKANEGKETGRGRWKDLPPSTLIMFEVSVNGGTTKYLDFVPDNCSGTETYTATSPDWTYSFKEGDRVTWKCYALYWRTYEEVGEVQEGSFTVANPDAVTLTFETDGLYDTPVAQIVVYNTKPSKPETPKRNDGANNVAETGLHFQNWYTKPISQISSYQEFDECIFDFNTNLKKNTKAYAASWAVLTLKTYDVTNSSESAGGSVSYSSIYDRIAQSTSSIQTTIIKDSIETLVATPNDGYKFVGWSTSNSKDNIVWDKKTYRFFNEGRRTVYALFEEAKETMLCTGVSEGGSYELTTPSPNIGGTYEGAGNFTVYEGNDITLKAIPKKDFVFVGWYEGVCNMETGFVTDYNENNLISRDKTYTFEIGEDTNIYALFKKCEHDWDDGVVTKQPTTSAEGVKTYTCKICGATKTESIAKLPEPGSDPNQKGEGGSAIGKGASAVAADNAIRSSSSEEGPKGSKYAPLQLRSAKQAKNSITLKWNKVKGAKKYVLYGNTCNTKGKKYKLVKIGNIAGSKSSYAVKKIQGKKLKKGTYHKFMIVALDSKNNVISTSKVVHAATKGNKKIANPSKVTTKKPKTLKKGKTFKLRAKQIGKNVKKHRGLCYETTKPKVATVTKKGVVKAVGKGTCYVYAYAQNGVFKKVKIVVK